MTAGLPPADDLGLAEFLQGVPLLAGLDQALLRQLADASELVQLPAGAWLFHQGDPGDTLYVVRSGRLEVLRESDGPPRLIGLLERGAALGELALLTGETRAAGVRARRESELVTVRRKQFTRLLAEEPGFALALTAALGAQLRRTGVTLSEPPLRKDVLTLLTLDQAIPTEALLSALVGALGPSGTTAMLTAEALAGVAPHDVASTAGRLLDRVEGDHDVVLLVTSAEEARGRSHDAAVTVWSEFCLRQADRVVLVVTPTTPLPDRGLREQLQGCDLIVCSPDAPPAGRLAPWLDELSPRSRHGVRTSEADLSRGIQRAARRLTGRSTGVVLSGGGARGYAHIGALAALEESGIVIDRIGGTSMGALVAALYAVGWSPEQMQHICRAELAERRPFADYTIPRHALLDGGRGRAMLERMFGERHVEELPLDWFAVSCDLRSAEVVVHRRGRLAHAVAASISLPGLAPPLAMDGRLLVDGGVLNNFPVDVMAATAEGPLIGVDVMRRWKEAFDDRPAPRGVAGLVRRLRPAAKAEARLPSIRETLACSTSLGSWRAGEANRRLARLVISPDLAGVRLLDWDNLDAVVDAGHRAAQEALRAGPPAWRGR